MNIETQIITAYKNFFDDEITEIDLSSRCYTNDKRYYAFITNSSGRKTVVKCNKNDYTSEEKIEGFGKLVKACRESEINVPLFHKTKENKYHTHLYFENERYLVWCEEFLPYETLLNAREKMNVTKDFFYLIGELVGRIHYVTKNKGLKFPWNSAMVLFEGFCKKDELDENYENAVKFYNTLYQYRVDKILLDEIWNKYNQRRNQIKNVYDELPRGGVQGDLSPNNIMVDEKCNPIAIIDFNQSGNDVYVNDMMQWAIYLVYGYFNEGLNIDKPKELESYFNGYTEYYNLQNKEKECINYLYNIIRPFRYEKVESILKKADDGNILMVNEELEWMLYELTRDDISLYLK